MLTHFGESCQKYGGEQPGLVWKLRLPDYDKKIGVRFLSLKGTPTMKLLHLPVLAAICVAAPGIASAVTISSAAPPIGRAACKETGCQYLELTVVSVSLKKNKQ